MFCFPHNSKKITKILEACIFFQHQGQQDFMECQDPLGFNVLSFKKNLFQISTSHCEDAHEMSKEWYFQQKLESSMWCGANFGVVVIIAIAWVVSISSSRLHKAEMFLYLILWRLSSWPSLNYISCIVNLLPSSRMLPLMISMQLETWQMQQCQCSGFFTWMVQRMHNTLHSFL
jgi:hypothetical protein